MIRILWSSRKFSRRYIRLAGDAPPPRPRHPCHGREELTVHVEHILGAAGAQVVAGLAAVRAVVRLVQGRDGQFTALHDHAVDVRQFTPILRPEDGVRSKTWMCLKICEGGTKVTGALGIGIK